MPPCRYVLKATVGTGRYRIVTAGCVALIVFPGPEPLLQWHADLIRRRWDLAADASFVLPDDLAVLNLACQVVRGR